MKRSIVIGFAAAGLALLTGCGDTPSPQPVAPPPPPPAAEAAPPAPAVTKVAAPAAITPPPKMAQVPPPPVAVPVPPPPAAPVVKVHAPRRHKIRARHVVRMAGGPVYGALAPCHICTLQHTVVPIQ